MRHAQAITKLKHKLNLFLVDPRIESLEITKELLSNEYSIKDGSINIKYLNDLDDLDVSDLFFAIIATNSDNRATVCRKILTNFNVQYMMLDKILFNDEKSYYFTKDLIDKTDTSVFVNCGMRIVPYYRKLKKYCIGQPILYSVEGGRFGLITNLIHYLDHIAYLTDDLEIIHFDTDQLLNPPVNSKRKGFLEINGRINVSFRKGGFGVFTSHSGTSKPVNVQIETPNASVISKEFKGEVLEELSADNWKEKKFDHHIPYQSELTTTIIEKLITSGEYDLIDYESSIKLLLSFLKPLKEWLVKNEINSDMEFPFS